MNKNTILIVVAIIGIAVTGVLIFISSNNNFSAQGWTSRLFGQSPQKIGQKAVDYINSSGLTTGNVSLISASEESGLVKIKIKVGAQEFDSYVTKDGKLLFPQTPISMTAVLKNNSSDNQPSAQQQQQAADVIKKTDSPMLGAYIVARCPFGLQMQRAMADAVKNVPALAQYIKVMYIGSVSGSSLVSMHGAAEATENLRQICVREEQPQKYWNYIACQMKSGDTAGCEVSTGLDSAKLNACVSSPDRGLAFAKKDFDLNVKYNISGSPTLILNGAQVSESNFGGRSSDGVKSIVCAGFNSKASFCSTKLNTAEAAASFSSAYSSPGSSGTGNSGATGANCAPAQ